MEVVTLLTQRCSIQRRGIGMESFDPNTATVSSWYLNRCRQLSANEVKIIYHGTRIIHKLLIPKRNMKPLSLVRGLANKCANKMSLDDESWIPDRCTNFPFHKNRKWRWFRIFQARKLATYRRNCPLMLSSIDRPWNGNKQFPSIY